MLFQPIDNLEQLIEVWPHVHEGLEVILRKCADECTWKPGDVFDSIAAAKALLVVGREGDRFEGFVVLTIERDFDGFDGHIWAAYNAGPKDYLTSVWPDIIAICKKAGCRRITMSSSQKGWLRHGKKLGFRPVTTTYKVNIG